MLILKTDNQAMQPARSAYWVLAILALAVLAPLFSLVSLNGVATDSSTSLEFWQTNYIRRILIFSLWQAFLSAALSIALALLVARAFAHHGSFPFRNLLLKLFGLPLVVPSIVAVMGVVSIYGSNGWIPLGRSLYGLNGILLAHVFFNMPLAVRLLLPVWSSIPSHHWHMSQQLGLNRWQQWRHLEWQALRETLPGVSLLIFMLCLTSFAVVLTLGGGPKSTTLEVAIYQSLRFDFDPPRAVSLALLQLGLCLIIAWASSLFHKLPDVEIALPGSQITTEAKGRWLNTLIITLAAIFVGMPLLAMIIDAFEGPVLDVLSNIAVWQSAGLTLLIGLSASSLSVVGGWLLLDTSTDFSILGQKRKAGLIEMTGSIVYVVPPLVIGTGLFVLLAPHVNVFDWAIPVVILINAMMGLPFVIRTLGPAMRQNKMRYQHLCEGLSLSGWHRFKTIDWPLLRKPVGLSAALVAAMAMGDLGVIALFGTPDITTLPLLLYHQLSAYLIPNAAVTAVFLLSFCLLVFWLLEKLIGGKSNVSD
ncbi:MAG: thiamine transport system permease protein [Gammaproteobacteria bacterium]|jgi:thiamine transport system permease protein